MIHAQTVSEPEQGNDSRNLACTACKYPGNAAAASLHIVAAGRLAKKMMHASHIVATSRQRIA
jgi:hypothetical protein